MCVVGIVPLRPVEFVIFRIDQKRRLATALEQRGTRFLGVDQGAAPNHCVRR